MFDGIFRDDRDPERRLTAHRIAEIEQMLWQRPKSCLAIIEKEIPTLPTTYVEPTAHLVRLQECINREWERFNAEQIKEARLSLLSNHKREFVKLVMEIAGDKFNLERTLKAMAMAIQNACHETVDGLPLLIA